MLNEIQLRIPYADTDQMGMVYYANYLVYFERGRTEWLRNLGLDYSRLEKDGIFLPVVECSCRYVSPVKYDDIITVQTVLKELRRASIEFDYSILRDGKVLAKGFTKHPFTDANFKPLRVPGAIKQLLEKKNA